MTELEVMHGYGGWFVTELRLPADGTLPEMRQTVAGPFGTREQARAWRAAEQAENLARNAALVAKVRLSPTKATW